MVESYLHFPDWPNHSFKDAAVPVSIKRGKVYKNSLNKYFVARMMYLPTKMDEILIEKIWS